MVADAHDAHGARLLLVVADGVRPDVLARELDAGRAPAMAALRASGAMHEVTSSFPSVTGPAYVPFLMGRHAPHAGIPGLRWFDRSRTLRRSRSAARSYAGIDIWQLDHDVAPSMPTLFDLARPSLSGLCMLGRGTSIANVGRTFRWSVRGALHHFRGDTLGWRTIERAATSEFFQHFARTRPRCSVLALTSADKFSHKYGADSEPVRVAISDIDAAVGRARRIATEGGWSSSLRIWVVGDHGHAPVSQHDDLHGWLESSGHRVFAHPQLRARNADVALMVSGNAMAQLYLEPNDRIRRWWPTFTARWQSLHDALLARESIDLVATAMSPTVVHVSHATRGRAEIRRSRLGGEWQWDYDARDGDALALGGDHRALCANSAWTLCSTSQYPDALVQLSALALAPTAGDVIVSAAPDWDLRARFEPVVHVSTHGALLRDQMMVPLIVDGATGRIPQRSADVMPSVLQALGLAVPDGLDGRSFV